MLRSGRSIGLIIGLTLVAAWVRLWRFPEIPPAFNYDEAYNVIDAQWLWDTGSFWVFLPGNTGRHALFHYLAMPFILLLGDKVFALRFVSVLIGIIIIPMVYRWVSTMFSDQPEHTYLGLIASAGVAFSFWHITLSRSGFRASLLLLLYVLLAYLFWQGWHRQAPRYIAAAGIVLGLSQYTYWVAGLLPLQLGLFALLWTIFSTRKNKFPLNHQPLSTQKVWLWIGLMALTSAAIFLPLGWLYLTDPTVLQYVTQSTASGKIAGGEQTWLAQLLVAIRIFFDGPVGLWRGQVSPLGSFDWLVLFSFWAGFIISIKRMRQPAYLFLLTGLLVLWLPAPLNDIDFSDLRLLDMLPVHHSVSNLRVVGVLPIYYTLVAVGLFSAVQWLNLRFFRRNGLHHSGITAFVLLSIVSGSLNSYNFFVRWPNQPFLSERYNGPMLELAQDLLRESADRDILLPFALYTHPTMHLFFDEHFTEIDTPPNRSQNTAILVTRDNAPFDSYMWLTRSETGTGLAYLTPPQQVADFQPHIANRLDKTFELAAPLLYPAQTALISDLLPLRAALTGLRVPNPVDYRWGEEIGLVGYHLTPTPLQPGQTLNLTLYWQNLVDQPIMQDIFIHVINGRGEGVGQVDGLELTDGHRWRAGKLTPTHHPIPLSDALSPGPYLIRLGLFNANSGQRLAVSNREGVALGDQALLGLFYVMEEPQPLQPDRIVNANLGQQLQLLGVTLPVREKQPLSMKAEGETDIDLTIYWQALQPVDGNYTMFVQVLNSQNQLMTSRDVQPISGNYPTSLWQPDEVVSEKLTLSLPATIAAGDYRLVVGMYDLNSGQRLTAVDNQGQIYQDNMVVLTTIQMAANKIMFNPPQ